jgi:hypothetical protein
MDQSQQIASLVTEPVFHGLTAACQIIFRDVTSLKFLQQNYCYLRITVQTGELAQLYGNTNCSQLNSTMPFFIEKHSILFYLLLNTFMPIKRWHLNKLKTILWTHLKRKTYRLISLLGTHASNSSKNKQTFCYLF